MDRIMRWLERAAAVGRTWGARAWATARDPRRVLPVLAVVALLLFAVPYTATGLSRVGRAALHWRSDAKMHWVRTTGTVTGVRDSDGMLVQVRFRDQHGNRRQAETFVADPTKKWLRMKVPMDFDTRNTDHIKLIGFGDHAPIPALLIAGAPLGTGICALVIAIGLWRRRRLVAVSATPVAVLRRPLTIGLTIAVAGIGAWAVGTVLQRGWAAIASATGHLVGTVFGDLLGVLVPLAAFGAGCLLTAWLARHRNHEDHQGLLSSAHRLIDRAARLVPSPEEMAPEPAARRPDASGQGTPDHPHHAA
jgi:hypothetical protein